MPHRLNILAALVAAVAVAALTPPVHAAANEDDDARMTVVADFNRDGIADIAQVLPGDGSEPATLKISLGNASGGFRLLSSALELGRTPKAIAAADFNGDGIPDLVIGDDDGSLKLFLGDGTGNFAPAPDVARLDSVVSIAVADFNGDGRPDIAVSDWRAGSVTVFLGTGKGGFRLGWLFRLPIPGTVARVSAADFNGDGNPDLAIIYGDGDQYTFDVMLGDGKGVFVHSPKLSFTRDPNSHCPA
ncbi:MAG: VCBS repeat-containing protein [Silvibacterium sp.]|nr:VCBS repeat-containing protein [Silvibacterium sp.]